MNIKGHLITGSAVVVLAGVLAGIALFPEPVVLGASVAAFAAFVYFVVYRIVCDVREGNRGR